MSLYRKRAYIMLLSVAAIWGAAAPVIKFTLQGIDPLPFLAYRFLIASIFSVGFFAYKIRKGKKFRRLRANLPLAITYGIFAVPIALGILFVGIDKSTVLDLTLVGSIGPLMVTAGGALFFHDHITSREKKGIAIVILGVLLNSFYPILNGGSELRLTGNLYLLLFLVSDSSSILFAKEAVKKGIKSANLTNLAFIVGAVTLLPLAIYVYGAQGFWEIIVNLPLKYHLGVWYMAILSGNLAYYLYVRGQRSIEVSEAVLFNYLQPVFQIPLALLWLNESLSPSFIIGGIVIAVGLYIAEHKKRTISS